MKYELSLGDTQSAAAAAASALATAQASVGYALWLPHVAHRVSLSVLPTEGI